MPILSIFLGIIIRMYHDDHDPPHFHVQYGDYNAIVTIKNGTLLAGKLPKRVQNLIEEWRKIHRFELERSFKDAKEHRNLKKIKGLE